MPPRWCFMTTDWRFGGSSEWVHLLIHSWHDGSWGGGKRQMWLEVCGPQGFGLGAIFYLLFSYCFLDTMM